MQRRSKPTAVDSEEVFIPGVDDLNVPPEKLLEYTICLYGTKGIGKTTITSSIPNSLVIMTEPLRKNLPIRQISLAVNDPDKIKEANGSIKVDAWAMFKKIIEKVMDDDSVQVLSIDTIDRMYDACLNHWCHIKKVRHPGGLNDFGALWGIIKDDFEDTLNSIRVANKGLILVSHTKESEIEVISGKNLKQHAPSCSGAALRYIKAACDYAFFYGYDSDGVRCVHTRGHDDIWTACGPRDHFISPSGVPLIRFAIPEGTLNGWSIVQDAFENKVFDADEDPEEFTSSQETKKSKATKILRTKK